jgi:diguanylate cyclase (GGDEF)-like protein
MSLQAKLWVAFALIASLATGLAAYGVHALGTTRDLIVRLYDEPLMGVNYARAASATLNEARGLMAQTLLLGYGASPTTFAALQKMEDDIADDLQIVREREHDTSVTKSLGQATISIAALFSSGRTIVAPPPEGVTAVPMPSVIEWQGATAVALLDDVVESVAANGFAYRSRAQTEMHASSVTLTSLCVAVIAMSALFVLLFGYLLIRPIRAATRIAEDVASGNQSDVAATSRRDELGRLLTALATMQASLRSRYAQTLALIQDKDQAAEALRQTNMRFDTALNNMSQGLVMWDADGRVAVANRRFCDIYGIAPECIGPKSTYREVLTLSVAAGNHPGRTVDDIVAERAPVFESRQRTTAVRTLADGRAIAISNEPMPDGGLIVIHEDITERCKSEEQIIFLAQHDALTQLPNRVVFKDRLHQALAQAERGQGFALLCLDLDQFKAVNDTLGHLVGDGILQAVAGRLKDAVRDIDTVARLGGDEFAILQLGVSGQAEATVLARRIIEAVSRPYEIEGHRISVGVSIGIALAPGDSAHPVQLMKNADLALYRAKQDGRCVWRFFEPTLDARAKARRELEDDLRNAMDLGQLELHYQPVVCSRRRILTGFETLLRWRHPIRGMVQPGEFIPVAEEIGIIVPVGAWVLQRACAEAASWPDHVRVAVNLSSLQFRGTDLVATVADALRTSGIAPHRLELEITESALLQNDQATLSVLHALHALGTPIAMDDFGTGYSSLSYLRSFPFDTIKIDRSFVSELPTRDECVAIVRSIIGLGNSLNMHITAEGVETEAQLEFLTAAGCTEIQGYLFSKPQPATALPKLIQRLSKPYGTALSGASDHQTGRIDFLSPALAVVSS